MIISRAVFKIYNDLLWLFSKKGFNLVEFDIQSSDDVYIRLEFRSEDFEKVDKVFKDWLLFHAGFISYYHYEETLGILKCNNFCKLVIKLKEFEF